MKGKIVRLSISRIGAAAISRRAADGPMAKVSGLARPRGTGREKLRDSQNISIWSRIGFQNPMSSGRCCRLGCIG